MSVKLVPSTTGHQETPFRARPRRFSQPPAWAAWISLAFLPRRQASTSVAGSQPSAVARTGARASTEGAPEKPADGGARNWAPWNCRVKSGPPPTIARAYRPALAGETRWTITLMAPADWPKIVTWDGSPPNAAMLRFTHRSAA